MDVCRRVVDPGLGGAVPVCEARHRYLGGRRGDPPQGLFLFRGPGHGEIVEGDAKNGPWSSVVGINPSASRVLLDTQEPSPSGAIPGSVDVARLLQVNDDRVLSTVTIARNDATWPVIPVEALGAGIWRGDDVLVTDGYFEGGASFPWPALITLRVAHDRLRLLSVRGFSLDGSVPLAQGHTVVSLTSVAADRRAAGFWMSAIGELRYVKCSLVTQRCRESKSYGDPLGDHAAPAGPA